MKVYNTQKADIKMRKMKKETNFALKSFQNGILGIWGMG